MTDLELALSGLGLSQYLDCLVQAGFDSWETLMEITEQDLESLNVKLGHRRKLQRQIANSRRSTERLSSHQPHHPLAIPMCCSSSSTSGSSGHRGTATGDGAWLAPTPVDAPIVPPKKRAYVHHPKPDTNAPARPYSAYVLFSKAVREDLKFQPLSFTKISKEVGERWQRLTPEEKHGWQLQSALPWQQYRTDLAKYRLSDDYQHYRQYLSKFTSAQVARREGDPSPHMNAATLSPKERSRTLAISHGSMTPPLWGSRLSNAVEEERAPVPRAVDHGVVPSPPCSRPLAVHTCESCRRRKVKCDGEKSGCGKCRHLKSACSFTVSTRDDQKRVENSLWSKLNAYETMLYGLIPRVGDEDRAAIESVLLTPLPIKKEAFLQKESKPKGDTNGDSEGDADGDADSDVNGDTEADADDETNNEAAQMPWIISSRPLRDANGIEKIRKVDISEFSHHSDQYPSPHSLSDQFSEDRASSSGATFSPVCSPGSASMWPQRRRQEQFPDSFLQQLEKVQQQQQQHDDEPYFPDTIFDKITTTTISAEPDEFGFLQHDDPSVVKFYPASIASAKNTLPGQEENLMILSR